MPETLTTPADSAAVRQHKALADDAPEQFEVPVPVYRVQLQHTGSVLTRCGPCLTTRDAQELVRTFIGEPDREYFVGIYLDAQYLVIGIQVLAIGDRFSVSLTAAEIFKTALLCNALGVVLAHNHPSGDATPSEDDYEVTGGFEIAGALIGVQVLDHIILGHEGAVSLRQEDKMLVPLKDEFDAENFLTDMSRRTRTRRKREARGRKAASASRKNGGA
jgi:DNA repair protein RadC